MNRADRQRIKNAVLETLHDYGKPLQLPLPIKAITKCFKNVRLIPYSKHMKRRGLSYSEMLIFAGTEDACTDYNAETGLYIIYYNDCDQKKIKSNRYRWNISHELGHIMLAHHKNYSESRLYRNQLSKQTYKKLEVEADMFAAYILVPHIVLNCLEAKEDFEIADLCKVSDSASLFRADDIKIWRERKKATEYDFAILSFYSNYVESMAPSKTVHIWLCEHRVCAICYGQLASNSYRFCTHCGAQINAKYIMRRAVMLYPGINTDEANRALGCPVCNNTDIYDSGNFCIICGSSLVNSCCNANEPVNYCDEGPIFSCNQKEPLPGNARFCPHCGSKTTFFKNGYLDSWNGEDDSDDDPDLPF